MTRAPVACSSWLPDPRASCCCRVWACSEGMLGTLKASFIGFEMPLAVKAMAMRRMTQPATNTGQWRKAVRPRR